MRRTDPALDTLPRGEQLFFCGDDVYWYAGPAKADDALQPGATWDPNIAMVAPLPRALESIANRQSVDPEALEDMAAAAVAVIVGAWDAEGLLIWEPPLAGEGALGRPHRDRL